MHNVIMEKYGGYLEEHYMDLDKMSTKDLCEAKAIAETMKAMLDADTQYNIVEQMENGDHSDIEMTWNEFYSRFRDMYEQSDSSTRMTMKSQIMTIIQ